MSKTLLYLWETICWPWKAWLALLSFLLGLWFAWLVWGQWLRRLKEAKQREVMLSEEVADLRRAVRENTSQDLAATGLVRIDRQEAPKVPIEPKVRPEIAKPKFKGDSGLEAAALMRDSTDLNVDDSDRLGKLFKSRPEHCDDFTTLEGIDAAGQRHLNGLGIYQFSQISEMSGSQIRALQAEHPSFREVHWSFWRDRWRAREGKVSLGALVSKAKPMQPPVDGVEESAVKSEKLSAEADAPKEVVKKSEVPLKKPVAPVPPKGEAKVPRKLHERPVVAPKVAQKEATAPTPIVPSHFKGEDMTLSSRFGWVYRRKPESADDFTALANLRPEGADLLGHLGIHKFKQIAHLKDDEMKALEAHDSKLQGPAWGEWRSHFQKTDALPEIPEGFRGRGVAISPSLGLVYQKRPDDADDLTLIQGVDANLAGKLNKAGLYRFDQIAALSDSQIEAWKKEDKALGYLPWGKWRSRFGRSARFEVPVELHGEGVSWSPSLGWVYPQRPAKVDPLTRIEGLGAKQEAALHRMGIYKFRQIALWSDEELAAVQVEAPELSGIDWRYWRGQVKASGGRLDLPAAFAGEDVSISPDRGVVYESVPRQVDDLTVLAGVDDGLAKDLNRSGLYRYNQIAHLSDSQVAHWEKVSPASRTFPWKSWRRYLKVNPKGPSIPAALRGEGVQFSPGLGAVYAKPPGNRDDFSKLYDVSETTAEKLSGSGVYRFRQMGFMDDGAVEKLKALDQSGQAPADWNAWRDYFKAGGELGETPEVFTGEPVGFSPQFGWLYKGAPTSSDDLTRLVGIESDTGKALNQLGFHRYEQFAQLTDPQIDAWKARDSRFGRIPWADWRARFQTGEPLALPEGSASVGMKASPWLGAVYEEAPEVCDGFQLLQGIGSEQESILHRLGIYRFDQIAHWDDDQIEMLSSRHPELRGVDWTRWRSRFQQDQKLASIPAAFSGEAVQHSPDYGLVYQEAPRIPDQLSLVDGVTPEVEQRLSGLGIHRFKQVKHLSDGQIDALRRESPAFKHVGWNLWRALLNIRGEADVTSEARVRQGVPLELSGENHVHQDSDLGLVYRFKPSKVDSLTAIDGIDVEMEKLLNERGIHTFWQLSNLRASQFVYLNSCDDRFEQLPSALREWRSKQTTSLGSRWRWRQSWDFKDKAFMKYDALFGAVYSERPAQVDDLCQLPGISGIGAVLLKDKGIYQYAQIAQLSDAQVAVIRQHHACFREIDRHTLRFAAARLLGRSS